MSKLLLHLHHVQEAPREQSQRSPAFATISMLKGDPRPPLVTLQAAIVRQRWPTRLLKTLVLRQLAWGLSLPKSASWRASNDASNGSRNVPSGASAGVYPQTKEVYTIVLY